MGPRCGLLPLFLPLLFLLAVSTQPTTTTINVGFLAKQFTNFVGRSTGNELYGMELGIKKANSLLAPHNLTLNLTTTVISHDEGKYGTLAALEMLAQNITAFFVATEYLSCSSFAAACGWANLPVISPTGCTDSGINDRTLFPTFASLVSVTGAASMLKDLFQLVRVSEYQLITNLDFKQTGIDISEYLEQHNISAMASQTFQTGDTLSVKRLTVEFSKAHGYRYIVLLGSHGDLRDLMIEFESAGMTNGDYVFTQYGFDYNDIIEADDTDERNAAALKAAHGTLSLRQYVPRSEGYTKIASEIWSHSCKSSTGCAPEIFVDETYEDELTPAVRIHDAVLNFATQLSKILRTTRNMSPRELSIATFDRMLNSSYQGLADDIIFASSTRDPLTPYLMENFLPNGTLQRVVVWDRLNGTYLLPGVTVQLGGGVTNFPPQFLLPDGRTWWDYARNKAAIFTPICAVVAVLFAAASRFYAKARVSTKERRLLDIARLQDAARAANTERDLAETANQNRRKFLRYMMHELRVPFHVLHVGLQSLKEDQTVIPSESQEIINQMREASEMMSGIMEDALNLQRIEDGRFEVSISEFDPVKMIEYVLHAHSLRAREHALNLRLHADEASRRVLIFSDETRLRQCLSNLVDNAIKFSPEKGVIDIFLRIDSTSGDVTIGVRDQGPGISLADREKLFQAWSQINSGVLQNGKGSGLGLSLVKMIMGLIGGECRIEPQESVPQGGQFTLVFKTKVAAKPTLDSAPSLADVEEAWLPASQPPLTLLGPLNLIVPEAHVAPTLDIPTPPSTYSAQPASTVSASEHRSLWSHTTSAQVRSFPEPTGNRSNASSPSTPSRASGMRVLVVDDVAMVRNVMSRLLRQKGAVVETAENGKLAVELIMRTRFDFVLMDKEMPVMDGFEACKLVAHQVPIFGITGNALEEELQEFRQQGALEVFKKPLKFELLEQALEKHNLQPAERDLSPPSP